MSSNIPDMVTIFVSLADQHQLNLLIKLCNERKKIIDFLTDKANSWTLIFISSDDYFNSKADVILRIDNRKNQSL